MKILHIINALGHGGAESLLVNMLPALQTQNIEISVLSINSEGIIEKYIADLKKAEIEVYTLNFFGNIYNPIIRIKLKKFFKIHTFDIVHVHLFPAQFWLASIKKCLKNTKLVTTEHSTNNGRRKYPFLKALDKFIYSKYDKIIAISDISQKNLISYIPETENITVVINNGFDFEKISHAIPNYSFYKELGLKNTDITILKIASFNKYKNHKIVFDSIKNLPQQYKLILCGKGPLQANYEKYVAEIGIEDRVFFIGYRHDIFSIMKSVNLIILSSYYEGLSGVTLESIASGTLFLASDVNGINDIVESKNCLFVQGDSKQLVDKILYFSTHPTEAKEMVEINQSILKKYTLDNMITKIRNLYSSIL